MNNPSAQNDLIAEKRRAIVSELRVQGMTIDEITNALTAHGIENPHTQKPFGRVTVYNDIQKIKQQWIKYQTDKIEEQKAKHLEEINQAKLFAMKENNLKAYISALNHEAKVMGFYAPVKSEQSIDIKEKQSAKERLAELVSSIANSENDSSDSNAEIDN